jgi:uncharacterized protein YjbJ (UPF0337 family)
MKGGEKRFGLSGLAIGHDIAKEALMGIDDKADNKAEELKGKGKETIGDATDDEDLQAIWEALRAAWEQISAVVTGQLRPAFQELWTVTAPLREAFGQLGRAQEAKGSLKQAGEKVKDAFKG